MTVTSLRTVRYASSATVFSVLMFFSGLVSLFYPAWTTPLSADSTTSLVFRSRRGISVGLFDQCMCTGFGLKLDSILEHLARGAAVLSVIISVIHVIVMIRIRTEDLYRHFMRAAYGTMGATMCIMVAVLFYIIYRVQEVRTTDFILENKYGPAFIIAIFGALAGCVTLAMYIMEQRFVLLNRSQLTHTKRNFYYMVIGTIGSVVQLMLLTLCVLTPSWTEATVRGQFSTGSGLWETCQCLVVDRSRQPDWLYATQAFCVMSTIIAGAHLILLIIARLRGSDGYLKFLAATSISVGIFATVGIVVFGAHLIGTNTYVSGCFGLSIASVVFSIVASNLFLYENSSRQSDRRKKLILRAPNASSYA